MRNEECRVHVLRLLTPRVQGHIRYLLSIGKTQWESMEKYI